MHLSLHDNGTWGTRLQLASWAGYQSRLGPYGSIDSLAPSDGTAQVVFAPEGRGDEPLSSAETQLVDWFETNEPTVSKAVKEGLLSWASQIDVPRLKTEADLARNIGLHAVNIHPFAANGLPYLGYEFGCAWDEEHGLGVLMHGARTVEVGSAEVALLSWMAEEDAKRHR